MANTIYLIPALGCSCEIFSRMTFPTSYTVRTIEWIEPLDNETLDNYAIRMFANIKFDPTDILLGVSLGTLLAQHLAATHPQLTKIILISGSQNTTEQPSLFRFARLTRLYKLIPKAFFSSKKIKTFLVTGSRKRSYIKKFDRYFAPLSPQYYRWAIHQVLRWQLLSHQAQVLRLHGENDSVFPAHRVPQDCVLIPRAGHLMIYFNARKVSKIISQWILD